MRSAQESSALVIDRRLPLLERSAFGPLSANFQAPHARRPGFELFMLKIPDGHAHPGLRATVAAR